MIVKRLRKEKNWSQEQLSTMCGVSLRTIQRVEAGNKASLETLKSLASVFEIEISKLTEEIIMIDKESDSWKSQPLWLRSNLIGIRKRSHLIFIELFLIFMGIYSWLTSKYDISPFGDTNFILNNPAVYFLSAYLCAKLLLVIDKRIDW